MNHPFHGGQFLFHEEWLIRIEGPNHSVRVAAFITLLGPWLSNLRPDGCSSNCIQKQDCWAYTNTERWMLKPKGLFCRKRWGSLKCIASNIQVSEKLLTIVRHIIMYQAALLMCQCGMVRLCWSCFHMLNMIRSPISSASKGGNNCCGFPIWLRMRSNKILDTKKEDRWSL